MRRRQKSGTRRAPAFLLPTRYPAHLSLYKKAVNYTKRVAWVAMAKQDTVMAPMRRN